MEERPPVVWTGGAAASAPLQAHHLREGEPRPDCTLLHPTCLTWVLTQQKPLKKLAICTYSWNLSSGFFELQAANEEPTAERRKKQQLEVKLTFYLCFVVQSLSRIWLFVTPWTAAHQPSLSFIISQSSLKLMSIELLMPFNHLILCSPLHLLLSMFLRIKFFSNVLYVIFC